MNDEENTMESPEGPGLGDRVPTPEETEDTDAPEIREDFFGATPAMANALVEELGSIIESVGEPPLRAWEKAVLSWSLVGLNLAVIDLAQPFRAIAGVSVVAGGRVFEKRKRKLYIKWLTD